MNVLMSEWALTRRSGIYPTILPTFTMGKIVVDPDCLGIL